MIGIISAALVCVIFFITFTQANNAKEKVNLATKKDVLFIMNSAELDSSQNYKILSSYQSKPYFLINDHLDYYCIQLEKFNSRIGSISQWKFGKEESLVFNHVRTTIASSGKAEQCFNTVVTGIDKNVAAYIKTLKLSNRNIHGAQIIFYHQPSNRILYVSLET